MGDKRFDNTIRATDGEIISPFDAFLATLGKTQIAHALITFLLLLVIFAGGLVLADWQFGTGYLPVGVIVAIPALIAALPLALGRMAHGAAYAQAALELLKREDLNKSGGIGDVVLPEPEPEPVRETVYVQTNRPMDVIPVVMTDGRRVDVAKADLRTVIEDGDLVRGRWLGVDDGTPLPPFAAQADAREYYDAVMLFLDKMGQTRRGKNNSRVLKYPPADVLAALKLT